MTFRKNRGNDSIQVPPVKPTDFLFCHYFFCSGYFEQLTLNPLPYLKIYTTQILNLCLKEKQRSRKIYLNYTLPSKIMKLFFEQIV